MDEYAKKQREKNKFTANRDASESSDRYDEDFESLSKSQNGLGSSILPSPNVPSAIQNKLAQPSAFNK